MFNEKLEKTVLETLQAANATNEENALDLQLMIQTCHQAGFTENAEIEKIIHYLIDLDKVDYEFDEDGNPNSLWLLNDA